MPRFRRLAAAAASAALLCVAGTAASAQVSCISNPPASSAAAYHGYSNKLAVPGAPGTSTIAITTDIEFDFDDNCNVIGKRTTITEKYTNGPGNSPYENRNPISTSCEATGTLSCP